MPSTDWSMSILGYARHTRNGSAVIGVTHVSTHDALRVANAIGMQSGLIWCDDMAAQVEHLPADRPTWAPITRLFADQRVINTEGMVGGVLTFVHSQKEVHPQLDADRSPTEWAEDQGQAWIEIVDNEMAYWGGLDEEQQCRLVSWFCSRRPLDGAWEDRPIHPDSWPLIKNGLYSHGWTRNCDLVAEGRKRKQEWWAGLHQKSALEHKQAPALSALNQGLLLRVQGQQWVAEAVDDICPLDDKHGRLHPPVAR